jgi:TM2 domain-containing membrane protein YozV
MAFLPWENIEYKTNLTKDEIINRIDSVVEPKGVFGVYFLKKYSYGKPYDGEIYENGFKIKRISVIGNSFKPIIVGSIFEDNGQNIINIKMRLHYIVIGFMTIWFGGVLSILLNNIIKAKSSVEILSGIIGGLIFLIFGYLIMTVPFKLESIKSKKYFNELFCKKNNEESI